MGSFLSELNSPGWGGHWPRCKWVTTPTDKQGVGGAAGEAGRGEGRGQGGEQVRTTAGGCRGQLTGCRWECGCCTQTAAAEDQGCLDSAANFYCSPISQQQRPTCKVHTFRPHRVHRPGLLKTHKYVSQCLSFQEKGGEFTRA